MLQYWHLCITVAYVSWVTPLERLKLSYTRPKTKCRVCVVRRRRSVKHSKATIGKKRGATMMIFLDAYAGYLYISRHTFVLGIVW